MRGFIIVSTMLLLTMFACGASFFSQNTGLLLMAFLALFPLIWAHGFVSGKSVEIQSPVRPKNGTAAMTRNVPVQRSIRKLAPDEQL